MCIYKQYNMETKSTHALMHWHTPMILQLLYTISYSARITLLDACYMYSCAVLIIIIYITLLYIYYLHMLRHATEGIDFICMCEMKKCLELYIAVIYYYLYTCTCEEHNYFACVKKCLKLYGAHRSVALDLLQSRLSCRGLRSSLDFEIHGPCMALPTCNLHWRVLPFII